MQQGFIKQYHSFFTLIQELADVAIIGLSLWLALVIFDREWAYHYHLAFVSFSLCFYLIARYRGLYNSWRSQSFTRRSICSD